MSDQYLLDDELIEEVTGGLALADDDLAKIRLASSLAEVKEILSKYYLAPSEDKLAKLASVFASDPKKGGLL